VDETVAELGAQGKQTLIVFNKADLVSPEIVESQLHHHPGSVALSARTGEGLDSFFQELELRLAAWRMRAQFRIPIGESALLAEIHRVGHVLAVTYEGDIAEVTAHIPPELKPKLAAYETQA
jgi:GTP-binding protein HflX